MTATIALPAVSMLLWCCGLYLLWRIPLCSGKRDDAASEGCTIIIPARDEEHNLPRLLQSLRGQCTPDDEILVVNDHSTDRTADAARGNGATVVESAARPGGWTGKTWACWQGAQTARNDLLLFIDADTWFATGALDRMLATRRQAGGMLSVQPFHCMRKPYERLSILFNIMVMIGVDAFSPHAGRRPPSGSFGPCVLCTRKEYFAAGGHRAVRDSVLENLALGPLFRRAGSTIACYGGRDTLCYRMYPGGIGELIEGWTKGFATGAAHTPPLTMALTILWIAGAFISSIAAVLSFVSSATAVPVAAVLGYSLYCGQLYWMARRIGNFGPVTCLLLPVHLLFFTLIYARSFIAIFIRKKVRWKGRTVSIG